MSERERALHLLRRIEREQLYASLVLIGETGFVRTLVLGVLRWRSRLDHAIAQLAQRRIEKLDDAVVEVLRLGVYQLQFMDVPPYAAVSETVDLAGRYAKRARGFVNAILRRAADQLPPAPPDPATRTAHPQWLLERWSRMYGGERAIKIAEANQELSYPDVLVLGDSIPPNATPSTLVDDIHKLRESTAELDRAEFYPMDEGSAVVAAIAAATSNDVLEVAAAPGGKTIYMRTRDAKVISNDVSLSRLMPLRARGERVVVSDGRRPPFARQFGTVLLDAPCSATGTIRKNPEIKWRLREADLAQFAKLQQELLGASIPLAREYVVYSTCSLEREENDDVVRAALASHPELERVDITPFTPAGVRAWVDDGVLRLTPESGADGFTAFVLRRTR
jgi:16S rRNA (cytosine967-C5)-methyltransferase